MKAYLPIFLLLVGVLIIMVLHQNIEKYENTKNVSIQLNNDTIQFKDGSEIYSSIQSSPQEMNIRNPKINVEGSIVANNFEGDGSKLRNLPIPNNPLSNVVFNNNGNIGIGTSSPSSKLDVVGNIKANSFEGDGSKLSNVPQTPNPYTNVIFNNNGNIGVGKSNPSSKLDVAGNILANSFEGDGSRLRNIPQTPNPYGNILFNNNNNLGIGINNPSRKLEVEGDLKVNGSIIMNNMKLTGLSDRLEVCPVDGDCPRPLYLYTTNSKGRPGSFHSSIMTRRVNGTDNWFGY